MHLGDESNGATTMTIDTGMSEIVHSERLAPKYPHQALSRK